MLIRCWVTRGITSLIKLTELSTDINILATSDVTKNICKCMA